MSALDTTVPDRELPAALADSRGQGGRKVRNTIATVAMVLCFAIAVIPLVWILWTVIDKGAGLLFHSTWWLNSQRGITPRIVGGGAYHAIVGTLLQALATAVIAVPLGIMSAILLVEYGASRIARVVSFTVDILSGLPSIVAALFVYALWVTTLGFDRSGFAVSLSLVLLMVPVVVRSTEEMLKLVPNELREASYALGVPKWKTIVRIVLPTAFSGILTGVLLGLARIMGETAPLLILVGYSQSINTDLFGGNMAALPLMINNDRQQALEPAVERVWAAALTLVLIVLVLNIAGRAIARFSSLKK
ncbi:phosphate ABC transporter permease PstA [Kineococcus rhizosphaerae]|uniref:Phosphate transport system permease protein PstA n=1 Tax=Kineococcus rhizosphaerae TaxID=559628 RepID=A0A2T0QY53_9ACTN|nr:phosphate ABC transporter permease PstA [Kineococcus rhizosphaerae]PRY11140.1 phosphate ABC transporter membrane protein 2 (PhoT family) [Kineococcus rhizosphaerae]